MNKKTAVQWLVEKLFIYGLPDQRCLNLVMEAQQIEKMQIAEAYRKGVEEDVYNTPLKTGEEYYDEKFSEKFFKQ